MFLLSKFKVPILLILSLIFVGLFNSFIPNSVNEILYALSLTIKDIIMLILPILIFSLLFKSITGMAKEAPQLITVLLIAIFLSNLISTMLAYIPANMSYNLALSIPLPQNEFQSLKPAWEVKLPKLIPNDIALFLGLGLGLLGIRLNLNFTKVLSNYLDKVTGLILKVINFSLPIFILGFIVKFNHDKMITVMLKDYSVVFLIIIISQLAYLLLLYFCSANFNIVRMLNYLRNMIIPAITGLTTMSSAAAMPTTIIAVEKNASSLGEKVKNLAKSIVPATVNVHLIGDCFAIPILAYSILKVYELPNPSFIAYFIFALYFVLAKFSVAAIPAGGIIVMLPILQSQMNFNTEMSALITTMYILFDAVITSINVLGNGAFALIISKLRLSKSG